MTTQQDTVRDERERIAGEIGEVIEEVAADTNGGIPWTLMHRLGAIEMELAKLAEKDSALAAELDGFRGETEEIFCDRDAAEEVVLRGQRIAALLQKS
jgi:hypothetical protein